MVEFFKKTLNLRLEGSKEIIEKLKNLEINPWINKFVKNVNEYIK